MRLSICFFVFILMACSSNTPEEPISSTLPELIIEGSSVFERIGQSVMQFEVSVSEAFETPISFTYTVEGMTAEPDIDFIAESGSGIISLGMNSTILEVIVLDDEIKEVDEKVKVRISNADNAEILVGEALGIIRDNDLPIAFDEEGYFTSEDYFGYELIWRDEFSSSLLNRDDYNVDLGNGCPDLCGWGNNELQVYSDDEENISITDGKLVLTAVQNGTASFASGRIHTKGKQEFQFGRIDIRARLPIGQGIWPAIWMLGANIDEVGWPASGEIDIMEMTGNLPNRVLGTAHWGPQGRSFSTFLSGIFNLDEEFIMQFHVFSIVWENNEINWYVDESKFHSLTPDKMQGEEYRFNRPFYLLLNLAVGGNFPGSPDSTTVFPQQMEIDYVRVFQ